MESITIPYKRKIKFPTICPCCLKQCTTKEEVMIINIAAGTATKGQGKTFNISTCTFCQTHWNKLNRYNRIAQRLFGVGIFFALGLLISVRKTYQVSGLGEALLVGLIVGAIIVAIGALIMLPLKPKKINIPGHIDKMTEPVSVEYGSEGKKEFIKFSFGNDEYYHMFREINSL